ncbi:MAG: hypothetical protein WDA27_15480 [Actinomycetota bacterium]
MVKPAWEIQFGPRFFIAVPTKGLVEPAWAVAFARLLRSVPPQHVIAFDSSPAVDMARNNLVEQFLGQPTCEWILWLDTDTVPPEDAIPKMMSKNLPIVSGLYRSRNVAFATQEVWPVVAGRFARTMIDGRDSLSVQLVTGPWKPGEIIPVDAVGLGCCLIHRRVFEAIPPPWFDFTLRYRSFGKTHQEEDWISEDWYFFKKVKEHGFPVFLDTTIECNHLTSVSITGTGRIESQVFK